MSDCEVTLRNETLRSLAELIEREVGIVYAEHNWFQLENRLEELTRMNALSGISELHKQVRQGVSGTLKQLLLDVATNNETSFFRDPRVFDTLEKIHLPALAGAMGPSGTFRIWSAASSFGQEPYSLAILLDEMKKSGRIPCRHDILATDISQRALERASLGRYTHLEVKRGLSPERLQRCFDRDEHETFAVKPELRSTVRFRRQNLKETMRFDHGFNLILCRNVLIYQKVESKREILKRISQWLAPGGLLVLGAGESLLGINEDFEAHSNDGVLAYRLRRAA